jgi:drug/metabolite transporter (DMT)-like permease
MHISILLWGFTGILGKLISLAEGPLVWYRLIITVTSLLILFTATKQLKLLPAKQILKMALVGFIIMLHWLCFYGSIKYSNVSVSLSCLASASIFSAFLNPLFNRNQKLKTTEILLGILGMVGIYLIFMFQQIYAVGIILALISAALSAVFTILNKSLVEEHSPEVVTFYELGSGMICMTLLMPLYLYLFPKTSIIPTSNDVIYLVLLGVVCTTVPFTLSLKALKNLSAFTMNLSVNLEPVYSIILAIIIFKENKELNTGFYAGVFLILLSVVLHTLTGVYKNRKAKKQIIFE